MATEASIEAARKRYKPKVTKVLLIGESPPAGGTFFYFGNSKLFQHTERAFRQAIPDLVDSDFLSSFQRLGCYLDDLCLGPVNDLKKGGPREKRQLREEHKRGEQPLAERIKRTQPHAIILIGLGIENNVRRAIANAGGDQMPCCPLPFPNWPADVVRFQEGLRDALIEMADEGVFT